MDSVGHLVLLDKQGRRLSAHLEGALRRLMPKLRRAFPALADEVEIAEILEEAGQRLADHEARVGPIEKLYGYAWVTVRSVATTRMRRASIRLQQATLGSEQSLKVLSAIASTGGSPEQIESDILVREVLATLSAEEQLICAWKKAGFSSKEIAAYREISVAAVDALFYRAKEKVRKVLGVDGPPHQARSGGQRRKPAGE